MNSPARVNFPEELLAYLALRSRWATDPVAYVRERIGVNPSSQQLVLLNAIAEDGSKVTVRSGHGTGKTAGLAWAIAWFLETRDFSRVPCTAPTASQLRDVLWAELSLWARFADRTSEARGDPRAFWFSTLFRILTDRVTDRGRPSEWFAVARTSSKNNPDALQGFHAGDVRLNVDGELVQGDGGADPLGRLMFVVDEASGVPDEVFQVAEGALSSHGARLLMVGNPVRSTGYFARSHMADRAHFTPLHFRTQDSPLSHPDYRKRLAERWGENSNIVRVRADGEFPKQDDQALISLEDAEACLSREPHQEAAPYRVGVDPARYGDDRNVIMVRRGRNLVDVHITEKRSTMDTVGDVRTMARKVGKPGIFVDSNGIGAGVVDRLNELGDEVYDVNVSRAAPNRKRSGHDVHVKTLRDSLYLDVAEWIKNEEPSFLMLPKAVAQDLVGELCSIHYRISSDGSLVVESKDDMKKRLGRSPDLAEALCMTFGPMTSASGPASSGKLLF